MTAKELWKAIRPQARVFATARMAKLDNLDEAAVGLKNAIDRAAGSITDCNPIKDFAWGPTIDELEAMLERNGLLTRKPPEAFREEILRDHLRKYKKRYNTLPEFSGEKEQVELGMSRSSLFLALEMYLGREVKNEKAVRNIDTESDDFLTAIHSL